MEECQELEKIKDQTRIDKDRGNEGEKGIGLNIWPKQGDKNEEF